MLRAYSQFFSDLLSVCLSQNWQKPICGWNHAWKHGNCGGFSSSIMSQEGKYLTLEHTDSQVINCSDLIVITSKLFPERNDLNSSVIELFCSESFINFLKFFMIAWLVECVSLPNLLLFDWDCAGVILTAEEGMSFGSPLIWNNLIKIPSQDQVKENVEEKAD